MASFILGARTLFTMYKYHVSQKEKRKKKRKEKKNLLLFMIVTCFGGDKRKG